MATSTQQFQTTGTMQGDINAGLISNGVYSPNIPADKVVPATPFATVPAPAAPGYNALMASTKTAETTVDNTNQALIDATKALGGQDAEQIGLQNSMGVTADTAALRDLTAQLTSLNNEANASKIKIEGQPIEQGSIDGQQRQVEHERTIKALGISASMAALQGNIQTANDKIDSMLKLKYGAIKNKIDVLNLQLDKNYKNLDAAQKVQADALKAANEIKLKELTIKEAQEKTWETNKNQALSNGAPLKVVQQAQTLKDQGQEDAARALLSTYTGTKSNDVNGGNGGSDGGTFTSTQINTGAAVANMPIADFKNLSADDKNYFINNSSQIKDKYKTIDDSKKIGDDPTQIESEINSSNVPDAVKSALIKYLWSVFPKPTPASKPAPKVSADQVLKEQGDAARAGKPWWYLGF